MAEQALADDVRPLAKRPTTYAYYVLAVLTVTNALSIADRNVLNLLLEPIKLDLHASDTSMSLLSGAAFVIFYSLFGIPIARWADRGDRRNILAVGIALWSVATALCGAASSFLHMVFARAGVGIGEATSTPTSMSLIADYFDRKARPKMIAIFNMAQPLGAITLTPLIGLVADSYGWRAAFYAVGVPGVFVALLLFFTVREPARGAMDDTPHRVEVKTTLGDSIRALTSSPPFMWILLGTTIAGLGNGTLGTWGPALMMRAYHVTAAEIGAVQAPISAIGGVLGGIGGGYLTGWFAARRRSERWVILLPMIAGVITVPAAFLYAMAPTWPWMLFGGFWGGLTIAFRLAPFLALAMDLAPAAHRSMAAAVTLIATNVVGQAGGPLVAGMISDRLTAELGPVLALRMGMLFAPFTLAISTVPFLIALRYFDDNGLKPVPKKA